jgi:hypothetical protein
LHKIIESDQWPIVAYLWQRQGSLERQRAEGGGGEQKSPGALERHIPPQNFYELSKVVPSQNFCRFSEQP